MTSFTNGLEINTHLWGNKKEHEKLLTSKSQGGLSLSGTWRRTTTRGTGTVCRSEGTDALRCANGRWYGVSATSASGIVFLHGLDVVVPFKHVEFQGELTKSGQGGQPMGCTVPLVQILANLEIEKTG